MKTISIALTIFFITALYVPQVMAKDVTVGNTFEESFKYQPPEFFPSDLVLTEAKTFFKQDQQGILETMTWVSKRSYNTCTNPIPISRYSVPRSDVLQEYGCLIVEEGSVVRETRSSAMHDDFEKVKIDGQTRRVKAGTSYVILNGSFKDNLSRPISEIVGEEVGGDKALCVTDSDSKLTTCSMPSLDDPVDLKRCHVVNYENKMMVVSNLDYGESSSLCDLYAVGNGSYMGKKCFIEASASDGIVSSDCDEFTYVKALDGRHTIVIPRGDAVVFMNQDSILRLGDDDYVRLVYVLKEKGAQPAKIISNVGVLKNTKIITVEDRAQLEELHSEAQGL